MTNADIGSGDGANTAKAFLEDIIRRVEGLYAVVITDRDGIPVIKVSNPDTPEAVSKPSFLASVSLAVEQAGKLGNGKNKRIMCMFNSYQVIHFNKPPLLISLIASSKANTGFLLNLESELSVLGEEVNVVVEQ
nr:ragulator complex protein LAMTOR3 isoform X2 [Parasteatoda tepidariorum]